MGLNMAQEPEIAGQLKLNRIYLAIILRYKEYIEEKESISVAELPTLVTPNNNAVRGKVEEIKHSFEAYDYDKDFYKASIKAFEFVKERIGHVSLPLQFWLTPEETLVFLLGDVFDKNILLCSLLIGLGNPSSKVVVVIKSDNKKIFVTYEYGTKFYLLDLDDGIKEFSNRNEIIDVFREGEDTAAYEFNDRTYIDIV
jgi:hypothetical protein